MPEKIVIQKMFDQISGKYDLLNNLLSLGTHWIWKKSFVNRVIKRNPKNILDGATGTGDIASLFSKENIEVTGIDISEKMLEVGKERFPKINFKTDDLCALSFEDKTFDSSTVSFGVRNVESLDKCLKELARVSKDSVFILEFGSPRSKIFKSLYFSLMKFFIPLMGLLFKEKKSYEYLIESSEKFPSDDKFLEIAKPYFSKMHSYPQFGGIAYIYELIL